MEINLNNYKHIHFVGIGGVSMYLLAIYCKDLGIDVSGSDLKKSKYTQICKDNNIKVYIGHKPKNIYGADLVVYTSAVDNFNVEVAEALNNHVNVVDRARFLNAICKNFRYVIGVSGTHGKTTTCAMIYHVLRQCGKRVSCHIGADVYDAKLNPQDEYLVLECCEYNRSFLQFDCNIAIILNIDNDHLDCYQNMYNLRNAFRTFLKRADCRFVFDNSTTKCIKSKAIKIRPPQTLKLNQFSIDDKVYCLDNVYGEHNINNATVAIAVCEYLGLSYNKISNAIQTFKPAGRRCQCLGKIGNVDIITDYAHHPTEIESAYKALKLKYNKVYLIFQPHTYSRTKILFEDFVKLFSKFEYMAIFKEFPAREHKGNGYSAKQLKDGLNNVDYLDSFKKVKKWILNKVSDENSCIAFVGAGDIDEIAKKIVKISNK